jgi:penicillin-binding protein 1A
MNKKLLSLTILFCFISSFALGSVSFIKKYINELPDVEQLANYKPNLTTKIYDINGEIIDEFYIERRTFVPLSDIPKNMVNAVIAIEDTDFYKHWGISIKGTIRAIFANALAGKAAQGGSTITQQLAKTIFLTREKKISRKIKEALLALEIERRYSKDEIMQMYLNQICYGHGVYGIDLASKLYFDKKASDLTLEECALLAGIPKAPSHYSPFINPIRCLNRRNLVLARMAEEKFITKQQAKEAMAKPLGITKKRPNEKYASYFVEYIRQILEPSYGSLLYKGGLKIYTTIDKNMQISAVDSINSHLAQFDINKASETLKQSKNSKIIIDTSTIKNVQGALVALDPKTGQIRALVGGRDFKKSQFNRAIQAKRQPGSSFKAIIYTAAIDQGFTPADILEDSPAVFYNDGRDWQLIGKTTDYSDIPADFKQKTDFKDPMKIWTPQNFYKKFRGKVLLREALAKSINICAIKILDKIRPATATAYAKKLGIKSPVAPYLSMALGSFVVTPLEITNAFATLANQGVKTEPYAIIKVCDNSDNVLEEHFPKSEDAVSIQTAYIMTNLLKGVIQRGTGWKAKELGRPAAGKTGTSNDFIDAWFIGYTPQLVAGVWVGYDDYSPLGDKKSGGVIACPIWTDFMKNALKNSPVLDFPIPPNIVFVPIDARTGLVAIDQDKNSYMEAFLKGTEPKDFSVYNENIDVSPLSEDENNPED